MGDTRDYLDSICDNCDHIDECEWDSPDECDYFHCQKVQDRNREASQHT